MGDGMFLQLALPVFKKVAPACSLEEADWSTAQKERRIADTLEPVLGRHRLVVDPKVIQADYAGHKTELERPHGAMYQTTRLTRDRGALLHDDALDALAGAVAWWNERLGVDVDQQAADRRAEALDRALEDWSNGVEAAWYGKEQRESDPRWVEDC